MLVFPSEWMQLFGAQLASGFPPGLGARFRYHERLWPQPTFTSIVRRILASDPDFVAHDVGEIFRIVTVEREYGAWVAITGRREGAPARRFIGAVFMDDFATALDVIAILPPHFARVEKLSLELVRSQRFEMSRRPRRFFYVPPPGWHGLGSGLAANWYPLDFPKNRTTLVVAPATFLHGAADADGATALDALGAGLAVDGSAREALVSAQGVTGELLRVTGRRAGQELPMFREAAVFVVPPYTYRFRMETTQAGRFDELHELFRAVAGSFRPLPTDDEVRVGRAFAAPLDTFAHWTT